MIVILPVSLSAQDTSAAILRSNGVGVLVNRNPAPASAALFSNDLVETQKTAVARIESAGSTADVSSETMVEFEGSELALDHGSLSVNTSRGLRVRVGCVTVTPVNDEQWTHYDVIDRDGKVSVSALKNDVYIDARSSNFQQTKQSAHSTRVTVREGEQKSREERCGVGDMKTPGSGLPGVGAMMNSPWAIGAGIAGVATIVCLGLLCRNDDPISPTKP
jgi:hypothetical protein